MSLKDVGNWVGFTVRLLESEKFDVTALANVMAVLELGTVTLGEIEMSTIIKPSGTQCYACG